MIAPLFHYDGILNNHHTESIMSNAQPTGATPKRSKWLWIGGALLILIIIGLIAGPDKSKTAKINAAETEAASDAKPEPVAENKPGFGVKREELTRRYSLFPYEVKFDDPIIEKKQDVVRGTGADMFVEIGGAADDVNHVVVRWDASGTTADIAQVNIEAMALLAGFHLDGPAWYAEQFDKHGTEESWAASERFDNAKVTVDFRDKTNTLTVEIEAK